jgi:phosphatidylglycerophosphate synthase
MPHRFTLATRANAVVLTRVLLAFAVMALLYRGRHLYLGACALTVAAIWMDGLDGWVARRWGEVSRFGAVLDILADRVVELKLVERCSYETVRRVLKKTR